MKIVHVKTDFHGILRIVQKAAHHTKAYQYLVKSGDAASRRYAYAESRLHYTRALEALAKLPDTEENRQQNVDVLIKQVANKMPETIGYFRRVLEKAQDLDTPELSVTPSLTIGAIMVAQGRLDKAKAALSQAIPAAEKIGKWPDWCRAVGYLGPALSMSGMGGIYAEGLARRVQGQALAALAPPRWVEAEAQFKESLRLLEC
jgi:tetratricopeptide (TPR) repeat protein